LIAVLPVSGQIRPNQPSDQQMGQLDTSPTIFAVLAAANAAGYDAGINTVSSSPLRKAVRDYFAKQNLKSLPPLQRWLRDHRPKDASTELSQYISFALFSAGPPSFKPIRDDVPLPPDAAPLFAELPPLLADFYQEAQVEKLWKEVQPYYDREIDKYTSPVSFAVLEVNAYFRNPTSGYTGRRFQVFIDLLGEPNQVQTRNYIDDYFVVVTPAAEPPIDEIRHAYLHYLSDPLGIKFADNLKQKKALSQYAEGSPILSELYKTDFELLATESFIKAVESRLTHKPILVEQALREGYVVAPAFAEQLELYEKQDRAMRLYFPDLVAGIDYKVEEKRLDHIDFLKTRPVKVVRGAGVVTAPEVLTGTAKTLQDADDAAYADHDYDRAKKGYLAVLEQEDKNSMHARAYYGLARIAVLQKDPETGDRLFRKVLELGPDGVTKSWSLLYLARLADSQGDREHALDFYRQAAAVPDAPDQVKQGAQQGLNAPPAKKVE
jgi:tetratricopeptide (TPR) repeat protein